MASPQQSQLGQRGRSAPEPFSPGTLHLSDLEPHEGLQATPPRKLKPLTPPSQRKKRRRTKKSHSQLSDSTHSEPLPPLMNQNMLDQLRVRLEQDDVRATSIQSSPVPGPHPLHHAPTPEPLGAKQGGGEERTKRKKKRRRLKSEQESVLESSLGPEQESTQPLEPVEMRAPTPPVEVVAESGDQDTEIKDKVTELPSIPGGRQSRKLPEFPNGPEVSTEFNMALQPATPINPNSTVHLYSEEDIVEVVTDRTILPAPQYTLPSSQPNPFTSRSKEVIFVERRDGRGFMTKRRDDPASEVAAEEGLISHSDTIITGTDLALKVHLIIQRLSLTAHGLVAGISLWDCIVLNVLSQQPTRHLNILEHYHPLTITVHGIYFLLLALVSLSLLDRFDFARIDIKCLRDFVKSPAQITLLGVLFCVLLALILTLSVAAIDESVTLYYENPRLWPDLFRALNITIENILSLPSYSIVILPSRTNRDMLYVPLSGTNVSNRLASVLVLTIARAVCCCVSWLAMIWLAGYDRLGDYLRKSKGSGPTSHNADSSRL